MYESIFDRRQAEAAKRALEDAEYEGRKASDEAKRAHRRRG